MLTLLAQGRQKTCDGLAHRDFLRIGALGLGGLSLAHLLALKASAAGKKIDFARDKSVVFLYLSGGASHIETFDPKMTATAEARSITGEVATSIPGVSFGGTFPQLAARAKQLAIIRSHQHPVGDHEAAHVHVLTGGTNPSGKGDKGYGMAAAYARLRGTNHPRTGLPTNIFIGEDEVDGQYRNERQRALIGLAPNALGPSYSPLVHETAKSPSATPSKSPAQDTLATNMRLNLAADRLEDRRQLLAQLDGLRRDIDSSGAMEGVDKFHQQAADLVLGGAASAFDFRQEDQRLVARYDTSSIRIGHKLFRPSTLGQQMLVARRLCEAGCGFVTVHSAGWDMHADGNNPGMTTGMEMLGRTVDKALSAFLDDVHARGLSEKILLVISGDFGRTPKLNAKGGRDHWTKLCTLAFAGGGLPMGQIIGQSTKNLDIPATEPITVANMMGTIMHTLFDVGQLRLAPGIPRELSTVIEANQPIRELAS